MEELPEYLPRDVRKMHRRDDRYDWEEVTEPAQAEVIIRDVAELAEKFKINLETAKVLEIGSRHGMVLDEARKRGINIVGLDVRPRASKENKQVLARAEVLPFADNTFEVIIAFWVFDPNVYNQYAEHMMAEIARVLKPGGFFIADPFIDFTARPRNLWWEKGVLVKHGEDEDPIFRSPQQ